MRGVTLTLLHDYTVPTLRDSILLWPVRNSDLLRNTFLAAKFREILRRVFTSIVTSCDFDVSCLVIQFLNGINTIHEL